MDASALTPALRERGWSGNDDSLAGPCPVCAGPGRVNGRMQTWACSGCGSGGSLADLAARLGITAPEDYSRIPRFPAPEFPCWALPPELEELATQGAAAGGYPADFVAVPTLALLGATIGNRASVRVKAGWVEKPIIWTGCIGEPGSGKSPGLDLAAGPMRAMQAELHEQWRVLNNGYETDQLAEKPVLESLYTSDSTMEALVKALESSPGLAIIRDELAGLTAAMDAYRKGGDREAYLSLWARSSVKVDRKTAGTSFVSDPVVCISGGVQPDKLGALLGGRVRDGLPDRFLLAVPDPVRRRWNENEVDPALLPAATALYRRLRSLSGPIAVGLNPAAKQAFADAYDGFADVAAGASGIEQGWLAKAPAHVARIALVLHAAWHPHEVGGDIGPAIMTDAVRVVRDYFHPHFRRALAMLGDAPDSLDARVLRRLHDAGRDGLARDPLMRALGGHVPAVDISGALSRLRDAGKAEPVPITGDGGRGRPAERWRAVA